MFEQVDIRLRVMLNAGERLVRCVLDCDHQARNRRLRVRIPTGIQTEIALAGAPLGGVARSVNREGACTSEAPVRTAPAHRYVAAASGRRLMK